MPNKLAWLDQFQAKSHFIRGQEYQCAKRVMDLAIVIATMPLWLPILANVYIIIWLSAPNSPVIFTQKRTGKNGQRFSIYKFRTMVPNAEELKSRLAAVNASGELTGPLKLTNDPRITRIGRFLRKSSLDELPQLFNILQGDMSLVGPRPTSWSPLSYKLWHTQRLDVLPGLTGLWQIYNRGGQDFDDWLRWDIKYLDNRCLTLDFIILIKTFTRMFKQRGAMGS